MRPTRPFSSRHPIRVVLSSSALLRFMSVRHGAALALAQLGIGAFFASSVLEPRFGGAAGWIAIAAVLIGGLIRAAEIESWALLVPGGLEERAALAFGSRAGAVAAGATLAERLLLGALASVLVGHYLSGVVAVGLVGRTLTGFVRAEDLATLISVAVVGVWWLRVRVGREPSSDRLARSVWTGVAILGVAVGWGVLTAWRHGSGVVETVAVLPPPEAVTGIAWADAVFTAIVIAGAMLPLVGGGPALWRAALDFAPPRVPALRRVGFVTVAFALAATGIATALVTLIVPGGDATLGGSAPLAGLALHLWGPSWAAGLMAVAVAVAAALILLPATHAALAGAERLLHQRSAAGVLSSGLGSLHARFGTPARAIDVSVAATLACVLVSGGRVVWLARAYGVAAGVGIVLMVAALARLRRDREMPFHAPGTLRLAGRDLPIGLAGVGLLVAVGVIGLLAGGDVPALGSAGLIVAGAVLLRRASREVEPVDPADEPATFDVLPATELSLGQLDVEPGAVLVPVRNPHALDHVASALAAAGDRDVVVMTVRQIDTAGGEGTGAGAPTPYERRLFADVVTLAERHARPVRLLVVPARHVVEAIVDTIVRIRASDVYVGESATLSSADQARLLGEAWERAEPPASLDVRLVICHRAGRSDTYHLGAHPPALTAGDLDLIHRLWRDAVSAVGPHVHHHDVVRAALRQMERQLSGPDRDHAVAAIREVTQPAEELTSLLRARDYGRLRDLLRNRHAGDVAETLTALTTEDQVLVFRVLPRKDAAAVFEYLSRESQETLLKAMAQEDVAELLNNMAPDDRTLFLEELPAEVTRQLLALLTPAERTVAVSLLGYPEGSVGRLMTPDYVAVRETWTVREVLDYIRTHGQDSETLNVIYVVDDKGTLLDDIRIRELLLAPLDRRVSDLMDRRFVALEATAGQESAVAVFRQYDRSALPVTDSGGMLIGIVTFDDVLDVAEATATREIHRIGGSEALDEPYMEVGFGRMVQKRAGWLTALFLGEMLTATAMGAFEAEISRAVVLALFVPLIISSGGNSGSQASTLVIRALALGEVRIADWWRVMRRELMAGLSLGLILGTIGFLRISIWSAFSDIYGPHWLLIALTVAVALVGVVLWGTLSGSLLPFVLKRLGFDPAASSAPFVATLVDVTGLVIYFSVALVVLRGTLL